MYEIITATSDVSEFAHDSRSCEAGVHMPNAPKPLSELGHFAMPAPATMRGSPQRCE